MTKYILILTFSIIWGISFSQSQNLIRFEDENKLIGYKDENQNIIVKPKYSNGSLFYNGLALVSIIGKGWTIINGNGEELTDFESIPGSIYNDFVEYDLISVKKDGKWGFINRNGELVIPYKYDIVGEFNEGLIPVKINNLWGFINEEDKLIIPAKYEKVTEFHDGLAGFYENGKWGFINKNDIVIIPAQYTGISIFSEGLCAVNTKAFNFSGGGISTEIINKKGETIFRGEFWAFHPYINGIANYWESYDFGGRNIFIDTKGEVVKIIEN
ncbi:MAG: WG repeat-containing protein [Moheibacter sp.]